MYKRILGNLRILCTLVFLLFISGIVWYIYENELEYTDETAEKIAPTNSLVYQCCTPLKTKLRTNLFFLKTHKTGSTTVQNIILRFAEKYSLRVMWTVIFPYYQPLTPKIVKPKHKTANDKYNIMAFHVRYTSELKSYSYPDTMMITLLRHPATLFQSAYLYYRMDNTTNMTFEQFVKAPVKPSYLGGLELHLEYKGYNMMSADLGFDLQDSDNTTAIQEFVKKIDREFDFVMITEYMDMSLVLLANLMGWPLDYVMYVSLNTRPSTNDAYVLSEEDKLHLMELNRVDALLYNHFLRKFRKCVEQYGEAELNEQVNKLREMNRRLRDRCIMAENEFGGYFGTKSYVLKNYFDEECATVTKMYY